jgi:hypothetical protein
MKKIDEIDIGMRDCRNVAFNKNGTIAVFVGFFE